MRERPPYEPPVLVRHQPGLLNKLSRVRSARPLTDIDGVSIDTLVETYGSPLFVFSEKTLVARYREMHDAFARRHPRVRLAWSYKTNYLDAICRVFHREGAWAEVVSDFELEKALRLGVRADHVHFNGPYKSEAALEMAFAGGALVHIDHFDELALAERVAERMGKRPGVALRLAYAVEGTPPWSRFGFDVDRGQAQDAVHRLIGGDRLKLVGLHAHLGTFIQDLEVFRRSAERMAEFANTLRARHGLRLDFVDLGGGFASHNNLKGVYYPGEQSTPSFARYAEAVLDGLSALDGPPDQAPTLVLENGRALVDDAGYLVATVIANKRLPDGRRAVVLDAGVNILFTAFWYHHDIVPAQPTRGALEPTVFYGPLCMNIDVMRESVLFPSLSVGDRVVVRSVGAYNVTQWMQFITYRPAVAMVGRDGRHSVIRARETLDVVRGPERMPPWLEGD